MSELPTALCSETELSALLAAATKGDRPEIEAAQRLYPRDPRIAFLLGSIFAGERRYEEAHAAMARAVELDPAFHIARFQLGLLDYTSGEPERAARMWDPLGGLPQQDPLRLFAEGLNLLARDDRAAGVARLREGMAANLDNPPLNQDMHRLIEALNALESGQSESEPMSETQRLLNQFQGRVKH